MSINVQKVNVYIWLCYDINSECSNQLVKGCFSGILMLKQSPEKQISGKL